MTTVAMPREANIPVAIYEPLRAPPTLFSEDMMECFGDIIHEERVAPEAINDMNAARVDEELERREGAAMSIQINDNRPETVLEVWKRQVDNGTFKFFPLVTRILFAIPSSSAQIKRDFGTAGQ
ncbi:hypothetical protein P3T76_008819 [Phytophthora citrophthora]|uniref:HAT C-terminal dimerisation domain-containing protein n=1 Tax=Phytophthora citrophthora TaxID=4793 RepID=A0AAD9GJ75_9STRA|nr:hypothetical protein P3T76_008819 [Phytophthora citrophthora]